MKLLELEALTLLRNGRAALDAVSLSIGPGECVGLIGRNGAGKTTLMRAALGLERAEGRSNLAEMTAHQRARAAAFIPQSREIAWPMTVEAVVGLGRLPWLPAGGALGEADHQAVSRALARLSMEPFRRRPATELSGGEQARALIARALAQETPLLIADEPTAGLDPAHQISAMKLFAGMAREGRSVLVALHDLALALRWCSRLVIMDEGRIIADGAPRDVLTAERLADVFRVDAEVTAGPELIMRDVI